MEIKETKILCKHCIKRKVCKYTDSFVGMAEKVKGLNDEHFNAWLICEEFMDFRNITYRREFRNE